MRHTRSPAAAARRRARALERGYLANFVLAAQVALILSLAASREVFFTRFFFAAAVVHAVYNPFIAASVAPLTKNAEFPTRSRSPPSFIAAFRGVLPVYMPVFKAKANPPRDRLPALRRCRHRGALLMLLLRCDYEGLPLYIYTPLVGAWLLLL